MTHRHSQGISGITAGCAAEFKQHLNHVLNLFFFSLAVAGHRLLDQARRVAMHWQSKTQGCHNRCAPCLAELEGRADIMSNKQLFHGCNLWLVQLHHFGQPFKNDQQPSGEILLFFRTDGAASNKAQPRPQLVDDAVAGDPRAWVNADNPQRFE